MYVSCSMIMWYLGWEFEKWLLYPYSLMYFHGSLTQWSLGRVPHVTSAEVGSKVIQGSLTFWLKFFEKWPLYIPWYIPWCIFFYVIWTQSFGKVAHECDINRCGVKGHLEVVWNLLTLWLKFMKNGQWYTFVGLGFNDPWVDSHMTL